MTDGIVAQLYHATCHAEAALSRATNPPRTATTSVRTSRESTPLASRKRKADSVGPSPVKQEHDAAAGEVGRVEEVKEAEEPEAKRIKSEPGVEEAEQQANLSRGGGGGGLFLPEPEQEEEEATVGAAGEAALDA